MKRPMLSIAEVMTRLNTGRHPIDLLIKSGKLPAAKIVGTWRIDPDDLEAYIDAQKAEARGETREVAVGKAFDADEQLDQVGNPFA